MKNRSFRTQLDVERCDRARVCANVGSPIRKLYKPIYDGEGRYHLDESGEENLYDFIQSFAESVDIHVLIKQFEQGNLEALQRRRAAFMDVTQMPTNFAEMLNVVNGSREWFDSLPMDVRNEFGNSFASFMASMDDGDFADRIGKYEKSVSVSDVVRNENVDVIDARGGEM